MMSLTYSNGNITKADLDPSTSRFALMVTFNALKERCERLEKQNLALANENRLLKSIKNDEGSKSILKQRIEKLEKHEEQLSHHIFRVVSENKSLYETIQSLEEEIQRLRSKLKAFQGGHETQDCDLKEEIGDFKNSEDKTDYLAELSEDDDSDISVLTLKDYSSLDDFDSVSFDDEIPSLPKYAKDQSNFYEDLITALEKNAIKQGIVEPDNINSKILATLAEEEKNNFEVCPKCQKPQIQIEESDRNLLLKSFEIIICDCKSL